MGKRENGRADKYCIKYLNISIFRYSNSFLIIIFLAGTVSFGCQLVPLEAGPVLYRESWPVPPPERAELPPVPSDQCSANCARMAQTLELKHEIDLSQALKKIARRPDLTKHDQLHLIEITLSLEMFGADKVFMELSKNQYLRITARQYLLNYTDRLAAGLRTPVLQQLMKNRGVPDELTPMENFSLIYFNLTANQILDYHRLGYQSEEIITIFWLAQIDRRKPQQIAKWYKSDGRQKNSRLWWQEIIEKKLKLSPDILKIKLDEGVLSPKKFQRLYQFYQSGLSGKQSPSQIEILTNEEIVCLVQLKMLNSYYGSPPDKMLDKIAKGQTFDDIVQESTRN
ncbi:MAG: hypothetical protein AAB019_09210 [Planctomycetota bacterium]